MTDNNSLVINGRLVKDAELHNFSEKSSVIQFSICCNNQKKEGDKWVDKPCFYTVKKYGGNQEKLAAYLTKGKSVSIVGYLDQDKWEKDGKQNTLTYIVAEKLQMFGGSKKDSEPAQTVYDNPSDQEFQEFPEDVPF